MFNWSLSPPLEPPLSRLDPFLLSWPLHITIPKSTHLCFKIRAKKNTSEHRRTCNIWLFQPELPYLGQYFPLSSLLVCFWNFSNFISLYSWIKVLVCVFYTFITHTLYDGHLHSSDFLANVSVTAVSTDMLTVSLWESQLSWDCPAVELGRMVVLVLERPQAYFRSAHQFRPHNWVGAPFLPPLPCFCCQLTS